MKIMADTQIKKQIDMKNKLLLSLCCGTLLFAGCTHDFNESTPIVPTTPSGTITINIDGNIDQVATRANESGFCNGDYP